jgi:hypothetical protein
MADLHSSLATPPFALVRARDVCVYTWTPFRPGGDVPTTSEHVPPTAALTSHVSQLRPPAGPDPVPCPVAHPAHAEPRHRGLDQSRIAAPASRRTRSRGKSRIRTRPTPSPATAALTRHVSQLRPPPDPIQWQVTYPHPAHAELRHRGPDPSRIATPASRRTRSRSRSRIRTRPMPSPGPRPSFDQSRTALPSSHVTPAPI